MAKKEAKAKEPKAKKEPKVKAEKEAKAPLDKKVKIIIIVVVVLLVVAIGVIAFLLLGNSSGSSSSGLNVSQVLGKWTLEVISNEDIGMLSVGPAYLGYNDFFGEKNDASIRYNEDGTFVITGLNQEHHGTYVVDEANSDKKAIMVLMIFADAEEVKDYTETYAIYAIRNSSPTGDNLSLTFSYLKDVYSFTK